MRYSTTATSPLSKPKVKVVETTKQGVMTALGAFLIWGCFPLYFKQLNQYNSVEIIGHRIIWTFVCILAFLFVTKRWSWLRLVKENPKWLVITFISGLIIASNWLTYVWAVNANQILEASLGYFISPLIGILLSMLFLGERLRRLQWVAVGFAISSVVIQIAILGKLPWVSLVLAASFSVYGIIQRRTPLQALDAMFIETALLVPFCVVWFMSADVASAKLDFWWSSHIWFLMLAGPITLIPLLLFNKSTKMVAYSILSFMQYLTPTFIFLLAVFYYREPFSMQRLAVFCLIWIGLAIFSVDLWQHRPSKMLKKLQAQQKNIADSNV